MYLAEIRGKLSRRMEGSEDILTSNVFSFFKYVDRQLFLRRFLDTLDIHVSGGDAENAEFLFWPKYTDRTEPDLVIIVGKYYLLIEAKLHSKFAMDDDNERSQLIREIRNGRYEASNLAKEFYLIALTADYYYKAEQFEHITEELLKEELPLAKFLWINWQQITHFLLETMEQAKLHSISQLFCQDLCELLEGKNLHSFRDFKGVLSSESAIDYFQRIFFAYETAALRGDFIGFQNTLSYLERLEKVPQRAFFKGHPLFSVLSDSKGKLSEFGDQLFYVKEE